MSKAVIRNSFRVCFFPSLPSLFFLSFPPIPFLFSYFPLLKWSPNPAKGFGEGCELPRGENDICSQQTRSLAKVRLVSLRPIQQFSCICWTFVSSFVEILALSTKISRNAEVLSTENRRTPRGGRTDGRTDGRPESLSLSTPIVGCERQLTLLTFSD